MKRFLTCFIVLALTISALPFAIGAERYSSEVLVTQLEDGSYITEEVSPINFRAGSTTSGTKTRNFYDSHGNLCWKAVLYGTFSYNGSSATCTSSSCDVSIFSSDWYVISKSASKSGNSATASVTIGELAAGVTVKQVPISLVLNCDGKGNIS